MAEEFKFKPLPPALKTLNDNTLSNLPVASPYTFESASVTRKGAGAGARVISGKRKAYGDYDRDMLRGSIDANKLDLQSLDQKVSSQSTDNGDDIDEAKNI